MRPHSSPRRLRALGRVAVATLALLVLSAPSHATSLIPMTVVDLLAHSDAIVVGQVQSVVDGFDARGLPYTQVTLKVSDTIRGQKADTYTFRQFGLDKPRTMPDGHVYLGRPEGWPTWRRNETALVFMYSKSRSTGFQTTVGLGQGKMSVVNGVAMNAFDNATLFHDVKVNRGLLDDSEQTMFDTRHGPVNEETFRKFLHRAVEGNWVKNGSIANAKH
jgi:hypothetical protein